MSDNFNQNNNFQGYPDNSIFPPNHSAGNSPTPPMNQDSPDFRPNYNQYQEQAFQQNFSRNQFQPQNNPNMNQYPYQSNQMYGNNPNYVPPQMPRNNGKQKKNGGAGTIILIVITMLLILAIIGVGLYIYLNSDDDSSNGKKQSSSRTSSRIDDEDSRDDFSSKKESSIAESSEKESSVAKPSENDSSEVSNMIETPDVIGLNYSLAVSILEKEGFLVDLKQAYDEQYEKDRVVSQSIAPGTSVVKGTRIDLTVSLGTTKTNIETPNVKGLHYETAARNLNYYGFSVEIEFEFSDSTIVDYVIAQDIAPGTVVAYDSTITLTVSKGPDPNSNASSSGSKFGKVVTEQDDLNVRNSPSPNGNLIGTVAKGSTVEVISEENGWYKISFRNGYGYVSKDYIQLMN